MKKFLNRNNIFVLLIAVMLSALIIFAVVCDKKEVYYEGSDFTSANESATLPDESLPTDQSVSSEPQEVFAPLVITSPTKNDISVSESTYAVAGTSDPRIPLTVNDTEITRLENGAF